MRCVQANLAVLETGTSERQVRHSTTFSGTGGSLVLECPKMEPNMLAGRSGFRRMDPARSGLSAGGAGAEGSEARRTLRDEVLLRCTVARGGGSEGLSRVDALLATGRLSLTEPTDCRRFWARSPSL